MADNFTVETAGTRFGQPVYHVKTPNPQPRNLFNDYTMLGSSLAGAAMLAVGLMAFGGPAALVAKVGWLGSIGLSLGASLVGGYLGNRYYNDFMDKADKEGIEIQPPSFFNKGLLTGLSQGFSLGTMPLLLLPLLGINPAWWVTLAVGGVTAAFGALAGGSSTQQSQQREYEVFSGKHLEQTGELSPELGQGRNAAVATGLAVGAGALGAAAQTGVIPTIPFPGFGSQPLSEGQGRQFTDYAFDDQGGTRWHPSQDRNGSFASRVRPDREAAYDQPQLAANSNAANSDLPFNERNVAAYAQSLSDGQQPAIPAPPARA